MYGTTPRRCPDGRAFQVLVSDDLDHWQDAGGRTVVPTTGPGAEYWAPEVAYADGRYWMYYSAGCGDAGHRIRVASSLTPPGPSRTPATSSPPTCRSRSTPRPTATPPAWWLFYATDLVEGDRPGTVLAVQRLAGHDPPRRARPPSSCAPPPTGSATSATARSTAASTTGTPSRARPSSTTARAAASCCTPGGNWQTPGYGVAVATAPGPEGPWHEDPTRAGRHEREHRPHRPGALQRARRTTRVATTSSSTRGT